MYTIIRKSDNKEIVVNPKQTYTYYKKLDHLLRFEQRNEVIWKNPEEKYPEQSQWRLPYAEEDGILPGDYRVDEPSVTIQKENRIQINKSCLLIKDPEWLQARLSRSPRNLSPGFVWGYSWDKVRYPANYISQTIQTPFGTIEFGSQYLFCIYYGEKKELRIGIKSYKGQPAYFEFEKIHFYIADMVMKERLFSLIADHWEAQHPRKNYALSYETSGMQYELYRWQNDEGNQYVIETTLLESGKQQSQEFYYTFEEAYRVFHGHIILEKYRIYLKKGNG